MATPLATAFIRVAPDTSTFRRDTTREADRSGRQAGEQFEESFDKSSRSNDQSQERGKESGKRFGGAFADALKVAVGVGIAKVGELIAGQLGSAMQGALDLTGARGELSAQLGLTAKESERIGGVAGKLFSGAYGENMQEVQGAITSVIRNIDGMRSASSATLEDMTQRAVVTGQVLNADVGDVTKAVSQLMRTGLAPNAKAAFDLINKGAQIGLDASGDLLDTVTEYSTQFREVGLSGPKAFGLISQALKGGARDADTAADAIKEFAIRSKTASDPNTIQGFKALGLNVKSTTRTFALGGPAADAMFKKVVAGIKGIEDPVKRNTVATALFGTKAEDLGKALFALDPSTAEQSLGKLAGTTDKANKALGDSAKSKLTAFKNSLQVNVTSYLANEVIPKLETFANKLQGMGVSGSSIAAVAVPLAGIGIAAKIASVSVGAITTGINGIKKVASGVSSTAGAVGRMAQGFRSAQVAESGFSGRAGTFGGKLRSAFDAGRRGAQSFATAALNASKAAALMALNVGKAALAHTRAGIAAALSATRTLLAAAAQRAIAIATRAWVLIQTLMNVVLTANPIGLVVVAIGALIAIVIIAYKKSDTFKRIVDAAFRGIAAAGKFMWNTVLQPIFKAIMFFITKILIPYYKMWWTIAKAVFSGIATAAKFMWNSVLKPVFTALKNFIATVLISQFRMFQSVVRVVWNAIRSAIGGAWNFIQGVFNRLKSAIGVVGNAFGRGASAIRSAWDKIKGYTKAPVNFVIGTVYNNGIRALWNKVMGWLHLPSSLQLGAVPLLASGGAVPARPNMYNRPTAIVGEGNSSYPEYVIPTDPKYRGRAQNLWAAAGGSLQMMADGGILGLVKKVAGKAAGLGKNALDLIANPGAIWDKLVSGLPSAKGLATSPWGSAISAVPPRMLTYLRDHAMKLFKAFASSFGGDGTGVVKAAINMIGRGDDRGENNNWLTRMWGMPGAPWCAMFVSEAIKQAGAGKHYRGYPSAAVASYNAGMKHVNTNDGRPGDLATYGSNDHINIIIKKALGGYDTVGGNQGPRVNRYVRGGQATVLRPMASGGALLREIYRQRNLDPGDRKSPLLKAYRKNPKGIFDNGGWGVGWPLHARKKEAVLTERQFSVMEQLAARGAQQGGPMITGGVHLHDGVDVDMLERRLAFRQTGRRF